MAGISMRELQNSIASITSLASCAPQLNFQRCDLSDLDGVFKSWARIRTRDEKALIVTIVLLAISLRNMLWIVLVAQPNKYRQLLRCME